MLHSIKSVDNLGALEDLIDFCSRERIQLDELEFENVPLNDLRCLIEAKHSVQSGEMYYRKAKTKESCLLGIIKTLLSEGWNFVQLRELTVSCSLPKCEQLIHIFSTVHKYNLSSSNLGRCKQILMETKSFTESIRQLNKLAIENHFQLEGKIKDLSELLAELKKSNPSSHLLKNCDSGSLDIKTHIFEAEAVKFHWNEKQILLWAIDMKTHQTGIQ